MSEYNDIGRSLPKPEGEHEKSESGSAKEIRPGSLVRVSTNRRNDPTEYTQYVFECMVATDQGQKAKLSFKTADGKRFVRLAEFDDLIPS